jgi:hypothetical protein
MKRPSDWQASHWRLGRAVEWTHTSGAIVRHCGHPTALRPYWVIGRPGTHRLLKDAQAAALEVLA